MEGSNLLPADSDVIILFQTIGLSEQKAKETAKNEALSQNLKQAILLVRIAVQRVD